MDTKLMNAICRGIAINGEIICDAEKIDDTWICATTFNAGNLLRFTSLESMIIFWLQYDLGKLLNEIRYDADGHHTSSYPDRVIPNEKARLITIELLH